MSIAQHSVAGEGETHPCAADSKIDNLDVQARVEFTCDTTNLPWVIFRAAHRASHLQGISSRSRALLAALARTVDARRPYAAIYARRELLTGRAMQSMRTFYRSLDDLEAAGLIDRAPQQRYIEAGLFGRAYLHLTQSAAELLGLVALPAPPVPDIPMETHGQDGQDGSSDQRSASMADGAIYKNLSPSSFQKRQPGKLPVDLIRLRSLGFHEFLIFRLMKEAGQHGKRLSDVVEATWNHLKRANRPINYLRKLLRNPADFRYQVQVRQQQAEEAQQAVHHAEIVRETLVRNAGAIFFDPAREHRVAIDVDGVSMTVHDYREASPRVAASSLAPEFVRALATGRLHAATPEDEDAFAARRMQLQVPRTRSADPAACSTPAWKLSPGGSGHLAYLKDVLRHKGAGGLQPA